MTRAPRTWTRRSVGPARPSPPAHGRPTLTASSAGVCRSGWRRIGRALRRIGTGVARAARALAGLVPPGGRGALPRPVSDYKAPNYWLDYRSGFSRRGLPGEVLRRVVGGSPTYRQVQAAGLGTSRAAALAIVPIALQVGGRAPAGLPRLLARGLLLLSPLTATLMLHDVGRYDAIGVVVLAALAAGRSLWPCLPLPVGVVLLAGAVLLAAASEEFLLAVVAPTAVAAAALLARGRELGGWGRLVVPGAVLVPGAVMAGASMVVPAPPAALQAARAEALRAGVLPAGAMGDSLTALNRDVLQNVAFFRLFRPRAVVLSLGLWAGTYAGTTALLGRLLGAGAGYRSLVAVHAAIGAALSAVGVDFRRWFGLALIGVLSTVALLDPPLAAQPVGAGTIAATVLLTVAGLVPRDLPVHPWGPVRTDRLLPCRG